MIEATVITFAYNQRPDLLDASVRSSLAMVGCKQVVLVDDGSDVPIVDVWGDDRVDLVRHPENRGVPAAYATALERIAYPWTVRSMSDDEQAPSKVVKTVSFGTEGEAAFYHDHDVSGCAVSSRVRYGWRAWERLRDGRDNAFYGGATLISSDLLKRMGPHPERLQHTHDWWLHMRIACEVGWVHVPRVLSTQGAYAHGLSRTRDERAVQLERRWVKREWRRRYG